MTSLNECASTKAAVEQGQIARRHLLANTAIDLRATQMLLEMVAGCQLVHAMLLPGQGGHENSCLLARKGSSFQIDHVTAKSTWTIGFAS